MITLQTKSRNVEKTMIPVERYETERSRAQCESHELNCLGNNITESICNNAYPRLDKILQRFRSERL